MARILNTEDPKQRFILVQSHHQSIVEVQDYQLGEHIYLTTILRIFDLDLNYLFYIKEPEYKYYMIGILISMSLA